MKKGTIVLCRIVGSDTLYMGEVAKDTDSDKLSVFLGNDSAPVAAAEYLAVANADMFTCLRHSILWTGPCEQAADRIVDRLLIDGMVRYDDRQKCIDIVRDILEGRNKNYAGF